MREPGSEVLLSDIERQAVEIGIRDADCGCAVGTDGRSLRARLARLARVVAGERGRRPLADAKLELVREFACRTRRQHRPAERLIPALVKLGYGTDQIGRLAALAA